MSPHSRLTLFLIFSTSLLISGCNEPSSSSDAVTPRCCCGTAGGGIARWNRQPYSCSEPSGIDCTTQIEQYPSHKKCPLIFPGSSLDLFFQPKINHQLLISSASNQQAAELLASATTSITTDYSRSCHDECDDKDSPFCLVIKKSSSGKLTTQLDQLNTLINSGNGNISKQNIMSIFGIQNDPCDRSDTSTGNNKFSNTGKACEFSTEFTLGATKKVSIHIPETITGKLDKSDGTSLIFTNQKETGTLNLHNNLNADFGGKIHSISYTNKEFLIGTERGCLALK